MIERILNYFTGTSYIEIPEETEEQNISVIERLLKPVIDDAYNRGFIAGVNAEKLVKENDMIEREHDLFRRGMMLGKEELLKELEEEKEIEEISAAEFEELAGIEKKPFGFVGTIDDIGLILDEAN